MPPPQIRNLTNLANITMLYLEDVSFSYEMAGASTKEHTAQLPHDQKRQFERQLRREGGVWRSKRGRQDNVDEDTEPGYQTRCWQSALLPWCTCWGPRAASRGRPEASGMVSNLTALELLMKAGESNNSPQTSLAKSDEGSQSYETKARMHLSKFGISGETAVSVPDLSGGQLVRAGLAWVTFPNPPPVLLLGEPTNDLDMTTIQVFDEALRKCQEAVVLISHDIHFLNILTRERGDDRDSTTMTQGDRDFTTEDEGMTARVFDIRKLKGVVSVLQLEGGVDAYRRK